jgi:peptidoglycan/LPS O-acetylase OafA/YrhL
MSLATAPARLADEGGSKTGFRPDVQGLRAVAVGAAVLAQLSGRPAGGLAGVDVFFVLSGFLITGLLLREHDSTGTISVSGFYRRRIQRIMPAAVLVLAVTVAASFALLVPVRAAQTLVDAFWSLLFVGNWHFALLGTGYSEAGPAISPVQHYWSLSVEEQFYLVWPCGVLALLVLAGRSAKRNRRRTLAAAVTALTVLSFAFAMWASANPPSVGYFSTFSRAWELGVGALVAIFAGKLALVPHGLRPGLAWVGLIGVVAAAVMAPSAPGFPVPGAALAVPATALVLAAGTGAPRYRYLWPVTNRLTSWVGDISYSLYLWHFPVIVLLPALFRQNSPAYYVLAAALTLTLAVASYYFVEEPARRARWRSWRHVSSAGREARVSRRKLAVPLIAGTLVVAAGAGAYLLNVPATSPQAIERGNSTSPSSNPEVAALQAGLEEGLLATTWPAELTPSLDELPDLRGDATPAEFDADPADPDRTIVVTGDSIAASWLPAYRAIAEEQGWEVVDLAIPGCPFLDAAVVNANAATVAECPLDKQRVLDTIVRIRPAIVVLQNTYKLSFQDSSAGIAATREKALSSVGQKVLGFTGQLIVIAPPPATQNPQECAPGRSTPTSCISEVPPLYGPEELAEAAAAEEIGASFVLTRGMFCLSDVCPVLSGENMITFDGASITTQYAERIVPALTSLLGAAGAWDRH